MKANAWKFGLGLALAVGPTVAKDNAATPLPEGVVVRQSGATIDLAFIDGNIAKVPADKRAGLMDDPERIEQVLRSMLMQRQLARQAVDLGIADDPVVQAEIEVARDEILARRRVARFLHALPKPDVEALAHEKYLASPEQYSEPTLYDVRHLFISFRDTGLEGSKKRAAELLEQYRREGGEFEDFVKAHSEEENAKEHGGLIKGVKRGDTEPDFEQAMLSLEVGQISEPVKTKYGVHVIQLIAKTPGARRPYADVKASIVEGLSQDYRTRQRDDFLQRLRSGPLDADKDLVASLRTRYMPGGEGDKAIRASEQSAPGEYERFATGTGDADARP